ncbi:hypothetical protein [Pedobacter mendelii]|uniref:hypothetical protein n=1 Tax=Pedobacter mendelii TaxID=1908240 RepID=UPI001E2FF101|nr:hypothetical protein [Pedobacter mendelii]
MINSLKILAERNSLLFCFGLLNMIAAIAFLIFLLSTDAVVAGSNTWLKPFKFAVSIAIFSWTMAWYAFELKGQGTVTAYSWVVIITLGFEIIYISIQGARGQLSHFNTSSSFYATMTLMMGIMALIVTLWTLYIGVLFFTNDVKPLPNYYLWAIRTSIILFVIFALEGGLMGARLSHSVGRVGNDMGLPLVKWNTRIGDLRVAHFIGMHALQIIPIFSWYILKSTKGTLALAFAYALLASFTFLQAIKGRPLLRFPVKNIVHK